MPRASFCLKIKNPEYGQARDQAQPSAVVDHTPTRFGYAQGNGSGTGVESLLRSDPSCKPLIFLLAPVAQRIRASDFGSEGWGFESLRARQAKNFAILEQSTAATMDFNSDAAIRVVAGLIYKEGRLLVCQRRAGGAFPLKWEFPGGKVEKGEADFDALRRELREELAIEVRRASQILSHDHSYAGGPAVSLRFYHVYEFAGKTENLVFEQISWCKLGDLAELDFLDGDRPLIEKLGVEGEAAFART
jgi:mutator protein MutT